MSGVENGGQGQQNVFAAVAGRVDALFQATYKRIGSFVGTRPLATIALSLLFVLACAGGFSQFNQETRPDKLWIPQGSQAQEDQALYTTYFPSQSRFESILLEAKSGSVLDKDSLREAIELHKEVEAITYGGKNLSEVCVRQSGDGHPCFIRSPLGAWSYDRDVLDADANHLATLSSFYTEEELSQMLGGADFRNSEVVGARVMRMSYFLQYGGFEDDLGEGWEESFLNDLLKCEDTSCDNNGVCTCGYKATNFFVYPLAQRSFADAFGEVIRGDVGLINAAFLIIIVYVVLNLGGLCHKVNSRMLLALACVASIVIAGVAGFGLAMWFQFDYTPVHSVLPFVILGIGVDDSFVIMNALDRTDPSLSVPERISEGLAHAGVSIMVTSLTDFVAFAISVSSALPALSSFCMYAALSVLMLFIFQVTFFTAMATFDTRRKASGRIDCCPCLPRGWPCCPTVPLEEAKAAVEAGNKDPNQLLCCRENTTHQGGRIGVFLERMYAPIILKQPVSLGIILLTVAWAGVCTWQATKLDVVDTQRNFIPNDSYVYATLEKQDDYFGMLGKEVFLMTEGGSYAAVASQASLVTLDDRINNLEYMQPAAPAYFRNWAQSFHEACANGTVAGVTNLDANKYVTSESEYYAGLSWWLQGPGARYQNDVVWVDEADPQKGIAAARVAAEFKPVVQERNDRIIVDAARAVEIMDAIRDEARGWGDLPGGGAVAYTQEFLTWETFRIIRRELFLSVGLCLLAVFIITLVTIAHPLTAFFVFCAVLLTVVDILGCLNMWGVAIDNVSVIQLVIAVGLCVDYAAHIGHNFMTQASATRVGRVQRTLGDVGAAVLNGGFSTFLAVMLLALSASYVFVVLFQTFFLTVVFGLFHGMAVLPAVLGLVGPASYCEGGGEERSEAKNAAAVDGDRNKSQNTGG